jgi:Major royal jelly protein
MSSQLPTVRSVGSPELVHAFPTQMPTGVTSAELRDGEEVAYPAADFNVFDDQRPADCLVSVQSVVVDPAGRLWLLDTGSTEFGPPSRAD